jgi:protein SCO1
MEALRKGVAAVASATLVVFCVESGAHEEKALPPAPRATPALLSVIRPAPGFTLKDLNNKDVSLSQLRGWPVLVAFVYTGCTTACPLLTWRMALLQRKLAAARVPAALVSVTVDPQRDDAATLGAFAKRYHAGPGWHFLREEPARLAPVLAAYEEWTQPLPSGELDHPARLHLIDGAGRVREIYSLAFFDEDQAFLDIKTLTSESRVSAKRAP